MAACLACVYRNFYSLISEERNRGSEIETGLERSKKKYGRRGACFISYVTDREARVDSQRVTWPRPCLLPPFHCPLYRAHELSRSVTFNWKITR